MGLKPVEFWNMTPLAFYRHMTGFRRNTDRETMQWRTLYALTHNIACQGEKGSMIEPKDVWPLESDSRSQTNDAGKPYRKREAKRVSAKLYARWYEIANQPITPLITPQ